MTETHAPDHSDHFFLGQAESFSGASPETVERCRRDTIATFTLVDRWIGRLLELKDSHNLAEAGAVAVYEAFDPRRVSRRGRAADELGSDVARTQRARILSDRMCTAFWL